MLAPRYFYEVVGSGSAGSHWKRRHTDESDAKGLHCECAQSFAQSRLLASLLLYDNPGLTSTQNHAEHPVLTAHAKCEALGLNIGSTFICPTVLLLHLQVMLRNQFWRPSPQGCVGYRRCTWFAAGRAGLTERFERSSDTTQTQTARLSHRWTTDGRRCENPGSVTMWNIVAGSGRGD